MKLIVICFLLSVFAFGQTDSYHAQKSAEQVGREIDSGGVPAIRVLSQQVLDILLRKAAYKLSVEGFQSNAENIYYDWTETYQYMLLDSARDIGDHSPLSTWLALTYAVIEADLGVEVCKATHLSDIKTFNYAIPVVFKPCSFSMDMITIARNEEYKDHFAKGAIYEGLVPVLTYWAVELPCIVSTSGLASFVCSPISSLAEKFMGNRIAPSLSDRIFHGLCG